MIDIRPLKAADIDAIKYIDSIGEFEVYDFIKDTLDEQQNYAYGMFIDDKLIGYATIGEADEIELADVNDLLLSDVMILPQYQHNSYGKILVKSICSIYQHSTIWADVINPNLFSWYESMGFELVEKYGLMRLKNLY